MRPYRVVVCTHLSRRGRLARLRQTSTRMQDCAGGCPRPHRIVLPGITATHTRRNLSGARGPLAGMRPEGPRPAKGFLVDELCPDSYAMTLRPIRTGCDASASASAFSVNERWMDACTASMSCMSLSRCQSASTALCVALCPSALGGIASTRPRMRVTSASSLRESIKYRSGNGNLSMLRVCPFRALLVSRIGALSRRPNELTAVHILSDVVISGNIACSVHTMQGPRATGPRSEGRSRAECLGRKLSPAIVSRDVRPRRRIARPKNRLASWKGTE